LKKLKNKSEEKQEILSIDDTKRWCPLKDNYCNENCIFMIVRPEARHCLIKDFLWIFCTKMSISIGEIKEHRKQEPYKKTFENLHAKQK